MTLTNEKKAHEIALSCLLDAKHNGNATFTQNGQRKRRSMTYYEAYDFVYKQVMEGLVANNQQSNK